MYYFFSFLTLVNKLLLPKLYKYKMQNFKKHHFLLLGYKYWVTTNYLKRKK